MHTVPTMPDDKPTSHAKFRTTPKARKPSRGSIWSPVPNPLGRAQPVPMDVESIKRQGWRDQKILVINEGDERLDFVEREFIRRIGDRLYGAQGNSEDKAHG